MSRLIKIIIGTIAVVVVLVFAGTATLTYFVTPEYIKSQATNWFNNNTDRKLEIAGDLHWTFFPTIGLSGNDVTITNPKNFGGKPFAHADRVRLSLKIIPLLSKTVSIRKLKMHKLDLNLMKNKNGKNNWNINIKSGPDKNPPAYTFKLNKVALKKSSIHYTDQQSTRQIALTNVYIATSPIRFDKPFTVSGHAYVTAKNPVIKSYIEINGKTTYNKADNFLTVKDFEFSSSHTNDPMRTFSIHTTGKVDFNSATFILSPIDFEYAKTLSGRGEIRGADIYSKPKLQGHITTKTFNLHTLLNNIGHPINPANKIALSKVAVDSSFVLTTDNIALTNLKATLDSTSLEGNMDYTLLNNILNVDLKGNAFVLDDFKMAPVKANNKKNNNGNQRSRTVTKNNPIRINGHLQFKTANVAGIVFSNLNTAIKYRDNILTLSKMSAGVFDGNTRGNITINSRSYDTHYLLNQTMTDINIGKMLGTLLNVRPLTGKANLDINIDLSGHNSREIKRNLSGTIKITAINGVFNGVDVDYQYARVFAYLSKTAVNKENTKQTPYHQASANLSFQNGVVSNPAFEMTLPKYHLRGSGTVNLLNEAMHYKIGIKSQTPIKIITPASETNLADYHIPLQIDGTLSNPKPSMDLPGIAKITLEEAAKEVIKKTIVKPFQAGENIGEIITKPVGDMLKSVLPIGKN